MSNENTGNRPLQLRGGRNYSTVLGIIDSIILEQVQLQSNEIVVLEGTDDFRVVILPDAFLGVVGAGFTVQNDTGSPIDAALYLEDKYGSSLLADEQTAIADGSFAQLEFDALFALREGDRLVVRITGSVTAGDGVRLSRALTKLDPSYVERLTLNEKITQSTFRFAGLPGVSGAAAFYALANFSSEDVDANITVYLADGTSYTESSPYVIPAGETFELPLLGQRGIETEVQFDSLPGAGYLYGALALVIPTNDYEVQPPLTG
jgi:hypothetical protein